METVTDFIFGGLQITPDGDCSHEIKRHLLLGRKAMINLDSILKSRDITLPTKGYLVKAMVFPVVMYGWESWTIKTAEGKELMIWTVLLEKSLEIPLDCQDIQPVHPKGHQSWLFIGRMDAEAELPILWPPDVKSWLIGRPWCWERLKAGGEGVNRGWDGSMASLTQRPWVWVNSRSWWWTGRPGMLQSMGSQSQIRLSDWTELNWMTAPQAMRKPHSTRTSWIL